MSFRQSTVSGGVMTQESGGADPHINPPSFIPAGNRRTRPSGQVPRSFAPARTSRQSGQAPSARPSVTGNDIEEPQLNANATASANVADNGRRTPPSFSPKTGRATRSTAPDAAAPRSIPPSRARMSSGSSRNAVRNPSDIRFPGPHRQQQTCPRSSAILAGRRRQRRKR